MSGASPVDEPPGKDGTQPPNPPDLPPVPEWPPGANPPGTNPPIPTPDTATTLPPGTMPGVIVGGPDDPNTPTPPATEPPVNVDVPLVTQTGNNLNCTMGNWDGEPTEYHFAWEIEGAAAGTDASTYEVQTGDGGQTAVCVVTAVNAAGSTVAPVSNELVITEPTGA